MPENSLNKEDIVSMYSANQFFLFFDNISETRWKQEYRGHRISSEISFKLRARIQIY